MPAKRYFISTQVGGEMQHIAKYQHKVLDKEKGFAYPNKIIVKALTKFKWKAKKFKPDVAQDMVNNMYGYCLTDATLK